MKKINSEILSNLKLLDVIFKFPINKTYPSNLFDPPTLKLEINVDYKKYLIINIDKDIIKLSEESWIHYENETKTTYLKKEEIINGFWWVK